MNNVYQTDCDIANYNIQMFNEFFFISENI